METHIGRSNRVTLEMYLAVMNVNAVVLDILNPKDENWEAAVTQGGIVSIHSRIIMVM